MAAELSSGVTIEVGDMEHVIQHMMDIEFPRVSQRHTILEEAGTIHRVRPFLRDGNEKHYTPNLVSIGPYHHSREGNLFEMEEVKLQYLIDYTKRTSHLPDPLRAYFRIVECHTSKAFDEYSGAINQSREEFVKMMVVDCCFILEFLFKWYTGDRKSQMKAVMTRLLVLKNDLLLVENQVPLFILDDLLRLHQLPESDIEDIQEDPYVNYKYNYINGYVTLNELALYIFMGDKKDARLAAGVFIDDNLKFDHLLHLYHASLDPKIQQQLKTTWNPFRWRIRGIPVCDCFISLPLCCLYSCAPFIYLHWWALKLWKMIKLSFVLIPIQWGRLIETVSQYCPRNWKRYRKPQLLLGIPNACDLRDTGFKFEKKHAPGYCFLDVSRKANKIKIPALTINETMLIHFKNLIAFEQCSHKYGNHFTAFATFMDYLIDTPQDVTILKGCRIIENRLGDDHKVADFFNNLCRGIYLNDDNHYLGHLFTHVQSYYTKRIYLVGFYRFMKWFIPDYFTNRWAIPSLIAAFLLLALAALQTFYTIYPYYHPRSN